VWQRALDWRIRPWHTRAGASEGSIINAGGKSSQPQYSQTWAPRFWLSRLHFGQQRLLQRFSVLALHLLSNTHPPSEASHGESENSHHRLTRRELDIRKFRAPGLGIRVCNFFRATTTTAFGVHALLSTPTFSTRKTNIASHASASDTHPFCTRSYYNNHRWHSLTWAFNTLLNQLCAFALHYRALPSWYWT